MKAQQSSLARVTLLLTGQLRHNKEKQAATKPNKIQAIKTEINQELPRGMCVFVCVSLCVCLCVCVCVRQKTVRARI